MAPIPEEVWEYMLMQYQVPGEPVQTVGVLLYDKASDTLHVRMRDSWEGFEEDDLEYLELLAEDIRAKAAELGPGALLQHLEDSLSNTLTLTERHSVPTQADPSLPIDELYRTHVLDQTGHGLTPT